LWATEWAEGNGCDPAAQVAEVAPGVEVRSWDACTEGADVRFYTVDGGKHGWPGSARAAESGDSTTEVSASELIWEFFAAHPLP
jgi:polyhydroxybutyrate depolymerase